MKSETPQPRTTTIGYGGIGRWDRIGNIKIPMGGARGKYEEMVNCLFLWSSTRVGSRSHVRIPTSPVHHSQPS